MTVMQQAFADAQRKLNGDLTNMPITKPTDVARQTYQAVANVPYKTVEDYAKALDTTLAIVSQRLTKLRHAGLVANKSRPGYGPTKIWYPAKPWNEEEYAASEAARRADYVRPNTKAAPKAAPSQPSQAPVTAKPEPAAAKPPQAKPLDSLKHLTLGELELLYKELHRIFGDIQ